METDDWSNLKQKKEILEEQEQEQEQESEGNDSDDVLETERFAEEFKLKL